MILRHAYPMNALGGSSSLVRRRLLHLQSHDATAFLSTRIHDASITASSTTSKKALSFLLHADRRPQSLPSTRSTDSIKTHFGPSLIGCHKALLDTNNASSTDDDRLGLGLGDLGILKAQRDTPSKVVQVPISLEKGLSLDYAFGFLIRMAPIAGFSLPEPLTWKAAEVLQKLWTTFKECEGVWFTGELVFDDGNVTVNAPFLEFDDFAVHRIEALQEAQKKAKSERDSNTAKAEDGGLFYIKLNNGGNIGSFGYGAGNAMATMDGLAMVGGTPTNFLDGGGGANVANAKLAIETLHRDSSVKSIFVNTFGGLTRCSLVAEGIIQAVKENNITTPMTVRVMGTEAEEANELLRSSGLPFTLESDFKTAAKLAVSQGEGRKAASN